MITNWSSLKVLHAVNVGLTSYMYGVNDDVDRRVDFILKNVVGASNNGDKVGLAVGINEGLFNDVEVSKEEGKKDVSWGVDHEHEGVSLDTVMSYGGAVASRVGRKWKKVTRALSGQPVTLSAIDGVGKLGKRERDKMDVVSTGDSNKKLALDVSSSGWRMEGADVDQSRPAQ